MRPYAVSGSLRELISRFLLQNGKILLCRLPRYALREILRGNVIANLRIQSRIIRYAGKKEALIPDFCPLQRRHALIRRRVLGPCGRGSCCLWIGPCKTVLPPCIVLPFLPRQNSSVGGNLPPQHSFIDKVLLRHGLYIRIPLDLIRKAAQALCNLVIKLRPGGRILHPIVLLNLPDLIEKRVFRLIQALLKLLRPEILHKLIRILIWLQVHDLSGEPRRMQYSDVAHRCLDARAIRIIGQKNLLHITL